MPAAHFPRAEIKTPPVFESEAQFIAQRLSYLAHQLPVAVDNQQENMTAIQIKLSNQNAPVKEEGQTLAEGFRDEFTLPFDKARWQGKLDGVTNIGNKGTKQEAATDAGAKFIKPEMVRIAAGSYLMGCGEGDRCSDDELPAHRVSIKAFELGKYEVTFEEYDLFAEATGRPTPGDEGWGRGKRPVINVSWEDAQAYAAWLSERTGQQYRLPTEAEWEYAARAGTTTLFSTGECIHTDQANYDGNYDFNDCGANTGVYRQTTVPVNQLLPNPWGLHHVHGNVWEWTQDCWHDSYNGAPVDGTAWLEGESGDCDRRVVRGGGWYSEPDFVRSAIRDRLNTDEAFNILGFRLARTL